MAVSVQSLAVEDVCSRCTGITGQIKRPPLVHGIRREAAAAASLCELEKP